jgi:hypothetical protein
VFWKGQFLEHGKAAFKHGNAKTPEQALQAENEQLKKLLSGTAELTGQQG